MSDRPTSLTSSGGPSLRLQGAARGLLAYALDDNLLLRLRDRADTVVAQATTAQPDGSGLFYTYRASGIWAGRSRFVPFGEVPLQ
jgi:hypothetical protein